jgi:hypothetical protein
VAWSGYPYSSDAIRAARSTLAEPTVGAVRSDRVQLKEGADKQMVDEDNAVITTDHKKIIRRIDSAPVNWVYAIHWAW